MTLTPLLTRLFIAILMLVMMSTPDQLVAYETEQVVDFTLPRLHGDEVRLSEFRGKWVVLNYWATWCAPCRKEIPDLSALNDARDDIIVLGLAFEDTDVENFDAFLAEFKPSYPLLLVDVYAPPEPFGAPRVLPTTIILNPEGYPVKTFLGPITKEDVESFIDIK